MSIDKLRKCSLLSSLRATNLGSNRACGVSAQLSKNFPGSVVGTEVFVVAFCGLGPQSFPSVPFECMNTKKVSELALELASLEERRSFLLSALESELHPTVPKRRGRPPMAKTNKVARKVKGRTGTKKTIMKKKSSRRSTNTNLAPSNPETGLLPAGGGV